MAGAEVVDMGYSGPHSRQAEVTKDHGASCSLTVHQVGALLCEPFAALYNWSLDNGSGGQAAFDETMK